MLVDGSGGDDAEGVGAGVLGGAVGAVEAVEVVSDGVAVADTDHPYGECGQEDAGDETGDERGHAASVTGQVTSAPGHCRV